MTGRSLCKGGTIADGSCRHCRAIVAQQLSGVRQTEIDQALLPVGFWPKGTSNGVLTAPAKAVRMAAVDDWGRFNFLKGVAPLKEVVVFPNGGLGGRHYTAFVVAAASGRPVALVDAPLTGNALYAFAADTPTWLNAATASKHEVLSSRPAEFLKRIFHQNDWRGRVRTMLAGL